MLQVRSRRPWNAMPPVPPYPEQTGRWHDCPAPPRLMGILNVTPDSFSDGGRFLKTEPAVAHARALIEAGADILDIGAESTRPGFQPISAEEELRRLIPVLDTLAIAFAGQLPVPLSIDTTKGAVARAALARGVTIVNDIWGFQADPDLPKAVAEAGASAVLMHNRQTQDADLDIVADMQRFFERSIVIAERVNIPTGRLILDPGIGFGKTPAQQVQALAGVAALRRSFNLPVLVGVSRKSFLGRLMGEAHDDRLIGTVAANLAAREAGATIFRVHDVAAHVSAFKVFDAIRTSRS